MSENYNKVTLDNLKENLIDWFDWNIDLLSDNGEGEPEFQLKREDRKLFIKFVEKGSRDNENNGSNYYMVLESLIDENEIETE